MLSVSGCFRNFETNYGYGRAASNILKGFDDNGIIWAVDDPTQPIEIFWGHPPYEFQRFQNYKIGYTAWESTGVKEGWMESMSECDEIWTPTPWLSEHFAKITGKPTFTYQHGVETQWKPNRHYRPQGRPFTFFHIGEPQYRKNGQLVVEAFTELFGDDPNYRLIMKATRINTTRIYTVHGSILGTPESMYNNIDLIDGMLSDEQLVALHHQVDALVYPSVGEGFGLHPLEALATGLPTISTSNWASYAKYITVPIDGTLGESPWQDLHPGEVFNVTKEQVKEAMLEMVENYDRYAKEAFKNSFEIHKEYSWENVNLKAAERLKEIHFSRILDQ
jgi:glycosyltransferase involved in cell wall biosynthesis